MQDHQNQQPNMNPDELAADLGWATTLMEQMMPKQAPVSPETDPGSEETLDLEEDTVPEEKEAPEADLDAKLESFKEEIKVLIKDELGKFKDKEDDKKGI